MLAYTHHRQPISKYTHVSIIRLHAGQDAGEVCNHADLHGPHAGRRSPTGRSAVITQRHDTTLELGQIAQGPRQAFVNGILHSAGRDLTNRIVCRYVAERKLLTGARAVNQLLQE